MLSILSFTVLEVGFASAEHAEPQIQGSLHLVMPPATAYCQRNRQILWAVTYEPESQRVIVANTALSHL